MPTNGSGVSPLGLNQHINFLENAFIVFRSGPRNTRQHLEVLEVEHFSFSQTSTHLMTRVFMKPIVNKAWASRVVISKNIASGGSHPQKRQKRGYQQQKKRIRKQRKRSLRDTDRNVTV